ncbi:armadillo-type protein [Thamnocephalis sphaerospora]|uniref:Armadillo-type protein n=1 Tax=Thamnocephalis sphaerospora TaxID=78915 RepID=A0A4P9XPZ1_9FUNG|nr:armadillo-type protein [Thamnocephalis sphaerospora]|eukprot:RKP08094.1 armadillo-type protein [Thamnocephalis sphaerospora]
MQTSHLPVKEEDVVERALELVAIGTDVSDSLDVLQVKAAATNDLVQQKALYGIISSQLWRRPELYARFLKQLLADCGSVDPLLRGLAARHICALNGGVQDANVREQLLALLRDKSIYVRLQAVCGVRRAVSASSELDDDIRTALLENTQHEHPAICVAAIAALLDLDAESISLVSALLPDVQRLVALMPQLTDSEKCIVARHLQSFKPPGEDDALAIMNELDEYLAHRSCAVVVAMARLFVHLSTSVPSVHKDVLDRAKHSLLSLTASGSAEIAYACFQELQKLASSHGLKFSAQDIALLRLRASDPVYVIECKINCMLEVEDVPNAEELLKELDAWIGEFDMESNCALIAGIGHFGRKIASMRQRCAAILFSVLRVNSGESPSFCAALRALDAGSTPISSELPELPELTAKALAADPATIALIQLVGNAYVQHPQAPYFIACLEQSYALLSSGAKLALLASASLIFHAQPATAHQPYINLLRHAMGANEPVFVRDRACFQLRTIALQTSEPESR